MPDQGIYSAFRSNKLFDVQLYDEYLDVSRFSSPANAHAFADYLRSKYADNKIDTIICVYPAALDGERNRGSKEKQSVISEQPREMKMLSGGSKNRHLNVWTYCSGIMEKRTKN